MSDSKKKAVEAKKPNLELAAKIEAFAIKAGQGSWTDEQTKHVEQIAELLAKGAIRRVDLRKYFVENESEQKKIFGEDRKRSSILRRAIKRAKSIKAVIEKAEAEKAAEEAAKES